MNSDSTLGRAYKDVAFGSVAGVLSKILEHPFDLAKVQLQAQVLTSNVKSAYHFSGPLDCFTTIIRNEGVRGLYRGVTAPVVLSMFDTAVLFWAYDELQVMIRKFNGKAKGEELSLAQYGVAAGGAGALTSFFVTPFELIKCRMQVQSIQEAPLSSAPRGYKFPPRHKQPIPGPGSLALLRDIIRTDGIRGLWVGHIATVIRETGGTTVWFGTKELVASTLLSWRPGTYASYSVDGLSSPNIPRRLTVLESAFSGACAGLAYDLVFFPADSVKSVIQTKDSFRSAHKDVFANGSSFWKVFGAMYKTKGLHGLYAGGGITMLKSVLSSGLIFVLWDGLHARFA